MFFRKNVSKTAVFQGIGWFCLGLNVLVFCWGNRTRAQELTVEKMVPHGILCRLDGGHPVLFVQGTPEEMGQAQGQLLQKEIESIGRRLQFFEQYSKIKNALDRTKGKSFLEMFQQNTDEKTASFQKQLNEIEKRSASFVPQRFLQEIAAMAEAANRPPQELMRLNFFPELFHCSGWAVRGNATKNAEIFHVRVLDYMTDLGIQQYATLMVFLPNAWNAWVSVSYPGLVGTVTAMNEKGLTMGEMGGNGEGKWDGLPMTFLIRRVMEECSTVNEALELMRSQPLTCDYYYVLSDAAGEMAAVQAIAESEKPIVVFRAGECAAEYPGPLEDVVYISGLGTRVQTLHQRLKENWGKIDVTLLQEMIKRPVAMDSNLHNAIFEPQKLNVWFAHAGKKTPACDEKYYFVNLKTLLDFYRQNQLNKNQTQTNP